MPARNATEITEEGFRDPVKISFSPGDIALERSHQDLEELFLKPVGREEPDADGYKTDDQPLAQLFKVSCKGIFSSGCMASSSVSGLPIVGTKGTLNQSHYIMWRLVTQNTINFHQ
jgi:hypothetical protein